MCWSLLEPYAVQLVRYVVAATPLLYHLAKIVGQSPENAYLYTRFLSLKGVRHIRDVSNRLLVAHNLPKVGVCRHAWEWLSREVSNFFLY